MAPISTSFLKRCAPPVFAHTASEKYLAEQAARHGITWLDLALGVGILSDFVLSLVSISITHWYVGAIEVVLSLYLL
ncbi:MAG TPA: hypothetical protein VGT82_15080, partial [Ktedonobacteraceae bacterium]|nr:hypothetical protein [Ktedonobacteraceae bacterium]